MWQGAGLNEGREILRTRVSSRSRYKWNQCALSPITASQSEPAAPISALAWCRQTQCHYGDLTLTYSFISLLRVLHFLTPAVQGGIRRSPLSELIHTILPVECSVTLWRYQWTSLEHSQGALFQLSWIFWGIQKVSLWSPCLLSSPFYLFLSGYPLTLLLTW